MDPQIVCLIGPGLSAAAWRDVVDEMAPAPALSVTLSELVEGDLDVDAAADALRRRLDEAQVRRPVLVGVSLGCLVAARFAARCPDRPRAVLLWAPVLHPTPVRTYMAHKILNPNPVGGLSSSETVDRQRIARILGDATGADIRDDLPLITAPAVVACGQDDLAHHRPTERAANVLPDAEHEIVDTCGHDIAVDAPQAFPRLIEQVLSRAAESPPDGG
ncbi:alpha/beta fold hydrolase [Nesterenkonia marinintestina]|uniref:alpha/beta fold hydrolase n=1 Tax=Nesterenkonia marinintestina TaxID=2979865 RepID=UPI0021BE10D2|nr:alpha/beta hydrolase [Nesterenkonia sp. GX14115]